MLGATKAAQAFARRVDAEIAQRRAAARAKGYAEGSPKPAPKPARKSARKSARKFSQKYRRWLLPIQPRSDSSMRFEPRKNCGNSS